MFIIAFVHAIIFMILMLSRVVAEEFSREELSKKKIKELKQMLTDRGVECKGCAEKPDYISMVLEKQNLPIVERKQDPPKTEGIQEDKKDIDDVRI